MTYGAARDLIEMLREILRGIHIDAPDLWHEVRASAFKVQERAM